MDADRPWLAQYTATVPSDLPLPTQTAIDQFRATALSYPDQPAVYYFETPWRFGDLDRLSNSLAVALQQRGLLPGQRVALVLQNMPQFWLAQLAVWKAGGIVVPLNPMFKARELEYYLHDSGAVALIALTSYCQPDVRQVVAQSQVHTLITTHDLDMLGAGPRPASLRDIETATPPDTLDLLELCAAYPDAADPHVPLTPDDIAYLVYTSGTTGPSKGAMNSHRNVAFNAEVYRVWMDLGPGDVIVGMAPLFHITGLIAHLALAGLTGRPLILAYRFDAGEWLRLIERWRGTFTCAAITAFNALMNHPDIQRRDLSSFRKAYSGGAPVAPALVQQFETLTGAYIYNIYGLTETTSPSHATPLGRRAPVDPDTGALSVGVPIPNTVVRVVDVETGQPVPPRSLGEFVTYGPGVVSGYWQKPEASRQTIRDGWLYTGDIGRMDEQGWFYLVDRKKDMIIASGFKVWPREVEDILYQHPAVREAAVVGAPDPYRGETVKAYVSLKPGASLTPDALIQFCRDRLAAYKYPRQVEIVAEIPKTATGKILRRAFRSN